MKQVPALADVNGDGSLDVIVRTLGGVMYVLNYGATSATNVSWATHRGNSQRDSNYKTSLYPANTPMVTNKVAGLARASFSWTAPTTNQPTAWRILRAENPEGPFVHLLTVAADVTSFTDKGLKSGWQYFYEVAAVYPTSVVRSFVCRHPAAQQQPGREPGFRGERQQPLGQAGPRRD